MPHILITSGPTREYLDPVRFLTNGSSGRMGRALAAAALRSGCEVTVVSGPVEIAYPPQAEVIPVVSTAQMLAACQAVFPHCDGLIAVAAPCDYRPLEVRPQKIAKTGRPLHLELVETPDIVVALAEGKRGQWIVAFALETKDRRLRAAQKLHRKRCDLIVANGPSAMHGPDTEVEVLDPQGQVVAQLSGPKEEVALGIFKLIRQRLMKSP
jgi:phosphopantothenoylcysteine decarboxylase/phosphopantothenate--cysteine ligase